MKNPAWLQKLQKRWNVNAAQVIVILIVFACTGFTVMFLKRPLLALLGANDNTWATIAYYVLILPLYNVILLVYGFIFGQFQFFLDFEKRFFSRIFRKAKDEN